MTTVTEEKKRFACENGLDIIGQPTGEYAGNIRYLFYKFKKCNHTQNIDTNLVRLGKFKCRTCEQEKLEIEAEEANLILIERASKGTQALYKFKDCGHTQRIGYWGVKNKMFHCRTCYYSEGSMNEKAEKYAAALGLKFLEKIDAQYGMYLKEECGHSFKYQISAVKASVKSKTKVHCQVCKENNEADVLKANNVVLVSRDGQKVTYKYACGHTNTQDFYLVTKSGVTPCMACKLRETIDIAAQKGIKPINLLSLNSAGSGKYKFIGCDHSIDITRREILLKESISCCDCRTNSEVRVIQGLGVDVVNFLDNNRKFIGTFRSCGHTRVFETYSSVYRSKTLTCFECTSAKHLAEAQDADLTLVGKASNNDPNYRRYRTSCCGHETDFEVTHVRRKSFNCPNCSEDRYSKESNLYVVKISIGEQSWLKVGIARNVNARVQEYGLPADSSVEIVLVKQFKTGREAIKVEKALHRTLKSIRECSVKMREILTNSGFTECYGIEHYDTVMKHIKELNL